MAPANPYAFILANVPNTASPPRKTTQRSKIFLIMFRTLQLNIKQGLKKNFLGLRKGI